MPEDADPLFSGFMNHDYILIFTVADPARHKQLVELCEGPWMGDEVGRGTWEVSNSLSPDELEKAIVDIIEDGDSAAYYYLTPQLESGMPGVAPSKRIFRVVLS
jgi:hypothetical protein